MIKVSYLIVILIIMLSSFTAGVIYCDDIKNNFQWILDDKSKYKEEHINQNNL